MDKFAGSGDPMSGLVAARRLMRVAELFGVDTAGLREEVSNVTSFEPRAKAS